MKLEEQADGKWLVNGVEMGTRHAPPFEPQQRLHRSPGSTPHGLSLADYAPLDCTPDWVDLLDQGPGACLPYQQLINPAVDETFTTAMGVPMQAAPHR